MKNEQNHEFSLLFYITILPIFPISRDNHAQLLLNVLLFCLQIKVLSQIQNALLFIFDYSSISPLFLNRFLSLVNRWQHRQDPCVCLFISE